MADEHAYKGAFWSFNNYNHFDNYKRGDYEVYVGEYATNAGVGNGNMLAALNDAAYIFGMENNGDLIKMSSYAPLFENVNTRHWPVNLIKFKSDSSFARISYYTIQMLNEHRSDNNLNAQLKILPNLTPKPRNKGSIGLATWDTQTEYKDIEVSENGKVVYKSDFINRLDEWQSIRGNWKVQDSAMAQTVQGAQRLMILKDKSFETYTLKLKARKLSGTNAFIIPFAVNGLRSMMRAHIGGLVNNSSMFELVMDESVSNVSPTKRLAKPIETGRWYDIRLEVGLEKVDCYLDDQLLITYTEPNKFLMLAGTDKENGDLIIKAVNVGDEEYSTDIAINGTLNLFPSGKAYTLSASSLNVENTFAEPQKFIPIETSISNIKTNNLEYTFPKYSITILRIKAK
jgi:alpha-L-arabinofuranosidase